MKLKAEIQERISMLLVDIIKRNGLSNEKLGGILGCGRNTINNYRLFRTTPSTPFINKLAEFYGARVNWIYNGEGSMYNGDGLASLPHAAGRGVSLAPGSRDVPAVKAKSESMIVDEGAGQDVSV